MTRKQVIDLITSGLILITSSVALMFNSLYSFKTIYLLISIFTIGVLMYLLRLIFCQNKISSTFLMISNIVGLMLLYFLNYKNPINLIILLFMWTTLVSFIKLNENKSIKENDKNMWIAKTILLVVFMVSGLLTIITLYDNAIKPIIEIGYFFYIYGMLEIINPIAELLFKKDA